MQEKDIKLLSEATKYFGRLAYTQSPKSEIERLVFLIHSLFLSK